MTTLIIQPFLSLNGKVFHYRIYVQDGFDVSDRYRWRGQLKASALEGGFCKGLPSSAPGAVFNYDPTREGRGNGMISQTPLGGAVAVCVSKRWYAH